MKKEQKKELRSKTIEELINELRDMRAEVTKLKIDMKTGKVENTNTFYRKKKDIARVLTFLNQKFVAKTINKEEASASI